MSSKQYELTQDETGIWSILKGDEVIETFEPNQEEDARERLKELMSAARKVSLSVWLNEGWRVSSLVYHRDRVHPQHICRVCSRLNVLIYLCWCH